MIEIMKWLGWKRCSHEWGVWRRTIEVSRGWRACLRCGELQFRFVDDVGRGRPRSPS